MTLLKRILKRKHIIAQSVCNHPKLEYYYQANNPKRKKWAHDTIKGWMPKEKEIIECVEVEIAPDNWIMAVDANNTNLLFLSVNYNIQWKECPCMKGVRLEDVTSELEEKALNEIKNNS